MAEETVKEVPTGMVKFEFSAKHGTRAKGEKVVMHKSTADALIAHKIGKITEVIKKITKEDKK